MTDFSTPTHSYADVLGRYSTAARLREAATVFSSATNLAGAVLTRNHGASGFALGLGGIGYGGSGPVLGIGGGGALGATLGGTTGVGTDGPLGNLENLIQVQIQVQAQMQQFNMYTNILKSEHESRMAAIRNIRP